MKFPSITATRLEYVPSSSLSVPWLLPFNPRFHPPFSPAAELRASDTARTRRETKGKERIQRRGGNVQTVRTIATLANRFRSRAISLLIEAENEEHSPAVSFPASRLLPVPVLHSRRDSTDVLRSRGNFNRPVFPATRIFLENSQRRISRTLHAGCNFRKEFYLTTSYDRKPNFLHSCRIYARVLAIRPPRVVESFREVFRAGNFRKWYESGDGKLVFLGRRWFGKIFLRIFKEISWWFSGDNFGMCNGNELLFLEERILLMKDIRRMMQYYLKFLSFLNQMWYEIESESTIEKYNIFIIDSPLKLEIWIITKITIRHFDSTNLYLRLN